MLVELNGGFVTIRQNSTKLFGKDKTMSEAVKYWEKRETNDDYVYNDIDEKYFVEVP